MRKSNDAGRAMPGADTVAMRLGAEAAATLPVPKRDATCAFGGDVLSGILRDGAQRLLAQSIDAEIDDWIERHAESKTERGHQRVVRNGHHPTRTLVTGVGPVEVSRPRVLDP